MDSNPASFLTEEQHRRARELALVEKNQPAGAQMRQVLPFDRDRVRAATRWLICVERSAYGQEQNGTPAYTAVQLLLAAAELAAFYEQAAADLGQKSAPCPEA